MSKYLVTVSKDVIRYTSPKKKLKKIGGMADEWYRRYLC